MGNLSRAIFKFLEEIKSSYWFIPTLMLVITIGLSLLSIELDTYLNIKQKDVGILSWIFSNQVDGARQVLSTIAGTMMTVAGVTFSMTLISISFAGAQIGPRILSNFMNDRGNQITLGTFISTFVFCLLVLRTITGEAEGEIQFIPHISIFIALVFAFLSLGVLIYFIHHIPQKMSMTESVDTTGDGLLTCIDALYPANKSKINENIYENFNLYTHYSTHHVIKAQGKGFIEYINLEAVIKAAKKHNCLIELYKRPGNYICEGVDLLCVHANENKSDDIYHEITNAIIWGVKRSNNQDILFPGQLLVEIAARALSAGVNDPYSAIECLNQLQAAFIKFSIKEIPEKFIADNEKVIRVLSEPIHYGEFFNLIMDSLRSFIKTDMLCTQRVLELLVFIDEFDTENQYYAMYRDQATSYFNAFKQNTKDEADITIIENLYTKLL